MKPLFSFIICLTALSAGAFAQNSNDRPWYDGEPWERRTISYDIKTMPRITVQGNKFVTADDGKVFQFRGIAISDPDKVERQGHWNKEHFQHVKDLGANIVRVPIHPVAWRERTPKAYMAMLDQMVQWCTELGLYVMLDWHTIGNLEMEMWQDPMYITTKQETYDFWRKISQRFSGNNTVAFYELLNEPTTYRGQLGVCTWAQWKTLVENMITIIRGFDAETTVLVGGFDWAYDLTPVHENPIAAQNIGYTVHPYPNKVTQPWKPKWERDWGFVASTYPVFATEFGTAVRGNQTIAYDDPEFYGNQILSYLEEQDMGWCIWVYDPTWGGAKIKSWNYEPTEGMKYWSAGMKGQLKWQKK
jgi:aryl-phospho-beta-D-glucosidase BglC (GH1 family)